MIAYLSVKPGSPTHPVLVYWVKESHTSTADDSFFMKNRMKRIFFRIEICIGGEADADRFFADRLFADRTLTAFDYLVQMMGEMCQVVFDPCSQGHLCVTDLNSRGQCGSGGIQDSPTQ